MSREPGRHSAWANLPGAERGESKRKAVTIQEDFRKYPSGLWRGESKCVQSLNVLSDIKWLKQKIKSGLVKENSLYLRCLSYIETDENGKAGIST